MCEQRTQGEACSLGRSGEDEGCPSPDRPVFGAEARKRWRDPAVDALEEADWQSEVAAAQEREAEFDAMLARAEARDLWLGIYPTEPDPDDYMHGISRKYRP